MDNSNTFCDALAAQLRAEKSAQQLSFDDLAKKSSVPKVTLQRYVSGVRDLPATRLDRIARALGLNASELVMRAEDRIK